MDEMRRIFENELHELHTQFMGMGILVNESFHNAIDAFINHDKELSRKVIENDIEINQREAELEQACFELIALQQPVTTDLRKIVTVMKASADLERIGDHAVSMAKATISVKGNKHNIDIETKIALAADEVSTMLQEVLDAYVVFDADAAYKIAKKDAKIDALTKEIYEETVEEMKRDPDIVLGGSHYMRIALYIERIGDYITNICEWIIYLNSGKIIELNTHNYVEE